MRAAVLRASGEQRPYVKSRPLRVEEVELAGPGPGQVLVRIASAGLCGSDLSAIAGRRPRRLPAVPGHEGSGEVLEVGEGVTDLDEGDHVVMVFVMSCGRCEHCRVGRPSLCSTSWGSRSTGMLADGTSHLSLDGETLHHWSGISSFAEFAVVQRESLVRIPREIGLRDAAVFGCAVITGAGAVFNTAGVRPGESVAVTGLGGVGLSAVMAAAALGSADVIAIDTNPEKLRIAAGLGATEVIDARDVDAVDQVLDRTAGGVQHSIDTAGVPAATRSAYRMVRRGGQLVVASLPRPDATLEIPLAAHASEERRVVGSYMGSSVPERDVPMLAELFLRGRLPVDRLRSATLRLDEINAGFDRLADARAVRDVVTFEDDARDEETAV